MVTVLHLGELAVDLVFKDIKNIHLSVYPPTGRVRIAAPHWMSLESIRLFAIAKIGWIKKQQAKFLGQERESAREFVERESHYVWGRRYLLTIRELEGRPSVNLKARAIELAIAPGASVEHKQALLEGWYRQQLRERAAPLVDKWQRYLNVQVERFFIQRMKTKWGSSNPERQTIRLNLELAKREIDCLDYVILHEIAHFVVPNHSDGFKSLLDHHMPSWRLIRQKLNTSPLPAIE